MSAASKFNDLELLPYVSINPAMCDFSHIQYENISILFDNVMHTKSWQDRFSFKNWRKVDKRESGGLTLSKKSDTCNSFRALVAAV